MPEVPPKKKVKIKLSKKEVVTPYGKYSGIVGKVGKPTEYEAMKNNIEYMKTNSPSSNVYRPENQHISMAYKKKNMDKS